MISRALRLLLPLVVALGATGELARAPQQAADQVVAVRAVSSDAPLSAERDSRLPSSVVAADARTSHRATRPADHSAVPEVRTLRAQHSVAHARSTGLANAPLASRSLAIPFDATAPPRQG